MTAWCYSLTYHSPYARHQQTLWTARPQTPPVPPIWQAALRIPIAADQYAAAPVTLRYGRFYPSQLLGRNPWPASMFRVIDSNAGGIVADFNPALGTLACESLSSGNTTLNACDLNAEELLRWAGIETALDQTTDFNEANAFARDDEATDAEFYRQPRRLLHVDAMCAARIQALYAVLIPPHANVLDLMSGWASHLPGNLQHVTGLGMNAAEMADNDQLDARIVHDLNFDPILPFADASFDVIVNTVSFEYLTQPMAVLAELQRALKPGGRLIVTFSNRYFPPKAIHLWKNLHPAERLGWVTQCLLNAGFSECETLLERGLKRPLDDRYAAQLKEADPLFAVWGSKV